MDQHNFDEKNLERLADYLAGQLPADARAQLEKELATDKELAGQLDLMKRLQSHHRFQDKEAQLRKILESSERRYFQGEHAPKPIYRRVLMTLAAALLLIAVFWFIFREDDALSSLSAEYLSPPAGLSTFRSEEGADPDLTELYELYEEGNYGEALTMIESLADQLPAGHSSEYYFDLGILQLFAGQPEDALSTFEKVKSGHSYDLKWYRAWAYLWAHKIEEARSLFEELADGPNPFQQDARSLLKELR